MIKIDALIFMFIVQSMLVFLGAAVFMFIRYRKLAKKGFDNQTEIEQVNENVENPEQENEELIRWKEMFNDLQENFQHIRSANMKLQETIKELIPEAEQSEELKKMISGFEQTNKELDNCLGTLEKENEELDQKIGDFEDEVHGLNRKLKSSVSKVEYDSLVADKNRLEIKIKGLQDQLNVKVEEYAKLDKNYMWLEKEYNALYESTEGEKGT